MDIISIEVWIRPVYTVKLNACIESKFKAYVSLLASLKVFYYLKCIFMLQKQLLLFTKTILKEIFQKDSIIYDSN